MYLIVKNTVQYSNFINNTDLIEHTMFPVVYLDLF